MGLFWGTTLVRFFLKRRSQGGKSTATCVQNYLWSKSIKTVRPYLISLYVYIKFIKDLFTNWGPFPWSRKSQVVYQDPPRSAGCKQGDPQGSAGHNKQHKKKSSRYRSKQDSQKQTTTLGGPPGAAGATRRGPQDTKSIRANSQVETIHNYIKIKNIWLSAVET